MGHGFTMTCNKCWYSYSCKEGIGFMFPMVYKETVEKAKAGKMGKKLKTFFEEHPDGAINAEYVTLYCEKCGDLRNKMDLTMYIPKGEKPRMSPNARWSVAFPHQAEKYVMSDELEEFYEKYEDYPHKCGKCRGKMRVVKEGEILHCPKCNEPLEISEEIMWD